MVALRGAGIGPQKIERGTVWQDHRIAFKLYIDLFGKLNDVLLKHVRLSFTC
ncbi:Uncharacterised protein [Klebsiella pneumoniae]|nr:Uncharacterised protein [Klebsiella pneumoniae]